MVDTLMEQIIKTIDYAVEERATYFGPHYASSLEGYGDVCRQNVGVQAAVKTVKQAVVNWCGSSTCRNRKSFTRSWEAWMRDASSLRMNP